MARSVLVGLVALAITLAAVGAYVPAVIAGDAAAAGAASPGSADGQAAIDTGSLVQDGVDDDREEFATLQSEFDTTTFEITVHEDGTATWTFRYERRLGSQSEEEEFETFIEEFESEETDLYQRFTEQATALTETGAEQTGREMAATSFNRTAEIEYQLNTLGVVEMTFVWENFAAVDEDGTVTVGDVFEGGMYIGAEQTLVVRAGDGLVFDTVRPEGQFSGSTVQESESVSWTGEHEFLDGRPHVTMIPVDAATNGETETGGGDSGGNGDGTENPGGSDGDDGERSTALVTLAVLLVLITGVSVAWYRSDRTGSSIGTNGENSPQAPEPAAAGSAAGSEPDTISDEELMTDEDRVVSLIRQNGGRMKQVDIVDETGWSKSKVSMLLSDMEDEGTISKLRVGRENIISLEGFEPEATKSPFDE